MKVLEKLGDYLFYIHTTTYKINKIINKDLLYSTGNSTPYSIITYMQKESEKELGYMCVYVYKLNHFAIYLKLTQYCKSSILKGKMISYKYCNQVE